MARPHKEWHSDHKYGYCDVMRRPHILSDFTSERVESLEHAHTTVCRSCRRNVNELMG